MTNKSRKSPHKSTSDDSKKLNEDFVLYTDLDNLNLDKLISVALAKDKTFDGELFVWTQFPDRVRLGRSSLSVVASRQFQAVYNICQLLSSLKQEIGQVVTFRTFMIGNNQGKEIPSNIFATNAHDGGISLMVRISLQLLDEGVIDVIVNMLPITINHFVTTIILQNLLLLSSVEEVALYTACKFPWILILLSNKAKNNTRSLSEIQLPSSKILATLLQVINRKNLTEHMAMMKYKKVSSNILQNLKYIATNERKFLRMGTQNDVDELIKNLFTCLQLLKVTDELNTHPDINVFIRSKLDPESSAISTLDYICHCYNHKCAKHLHVTDIVTLCPVCNIATFCDKRNHIDRCEHCPKTTFDVAAWELEEQVYKVKRSPSPKTDILEVPSNKELSLSQMRYLEQAGDGSVSLPFQRTRERSKSSTQVKSMLDLPRENLWAMVHSTIIHETNTWIRETFSRRYKMNKEELFKHADFWTEYTLRVHEEGYCECGNPVKHCYPLYIPEVYDEMKRTPPMLQRVVDCLNIALMVMLAFPQLIFLRIFFLLSVLRGLLSVVMPKKRKR